MPLLDEADDVILDELDEELLAEVGPQIVVKYWAPGEFPDGASDDITDTSIVRAFTANLRSAGQGTIELPNTAAVLPASGGMVTFDVDDGSEADPVRALACLCRVMSRKTIAPDGDADQRTTWDMPEHIAIFDRGLILPPNGAGFYPAPDTVSFNWTHREFDDSLWTTANLIAVVEDAQSGGGTPWGGDPGQAWSDKWTLGLESIVEIIGPDDGTTTGLADNNAANQNHYFRQLFYVPTAGRHSVFVGADNYAEFWCDNVLLGTYNDWKDTREFPVDLSVGWHLMGVYLQNIPQVSNNPAGYSWAVLNTGYPGSFVAWSTAADTVHVEYQTAVPGMAVTQALRLVVEDLIAAGIAWASDIVLDCDDTTFSDGEPAGIEPNVTAEVGSTILEFIDKLRNGGYCDIWFDPNDWTLHVYEYGTWAPPSGLVLDETNLTSLEHKTEDTIADRLLAKSDALGWSIIGSGTGALGFVSLGSEVAAYDVDAIGNEILNIYGSPRTEIATQYAWQAVTDGMPWFVAPDPSDPSSPTLVPGALGTAPDLDGSPTEERALSITVTQAEGVEDVGVQISWKDRIQEFEERVMRELKQ